MSLLISCEGEGKWLPTQTTRPPTPASMTSQDTRPTALFEDRGVGHQFVSNYAQGNLVASLASPWDRSWLDLHRYRERSEAKHRRWLGHDEEATQLTLDPQDIAGDYLDRLERASRGLILRDQIAIHLSIRVCPERNRSNKPSRTDVGLIYDSERAAEQEFAMAWIDEVYSRSVDLRVRRNYPGRGHSAPCVTRTLRRRLGDLPYMGIGVWLNERWAKRDNLRRSEAIDLLVSSLETVVCELHEYRSQEHRSQEHGPQAA